MSLNTDTLRKIINRKAIMHAIFWISLLILVFAFENWNNKKIDFAFFFQYTIAFVIFLITCYINIYYLVPKYFKNKRYSLYAILLISSMILSCLLIVVIRQASIDLNFLFPEDEHLKNNLSYFLHILLGEGMLVIITAMFYILEEWIKLQDVNIKMKAIESEKIQSELQALKAQINPHFLFNTLNNIYSHSLDKSEKVPEMILKLSELMSYILYECHEEKVLVENEINFIKNYLELEKLRYEDHLDVILNVEKFSLNQKIIPLLFITFIENAFKHNGSHGTKKPYVKVELKNEDARMHFSVYNSTSKDIPIKREKEGGLGIENAKKRLELIYPGKHQLTITKKEEEFQVQLIIENHGA